MSVVGAATYDMEACSLGGNMQPTVSDDKQGNLNGGSQHENDWRGQPHLTKCYKKSYDILTSSPSKAEMKSFAEENCLEMIFVDPQEDGVSSNDVQMQLSTSAQFEAKHRLPCNGSSKHVEFQKGNVDIHKTATAYRKPQLGASRKRSCLSSNPLPNICSIVLSNPKSTTEAESPVHDSPSNPDCPNSAEEQPAPNQVELVNGSRRKRSTATKASKVPMLSLVKAGDAGARNAALSVGACGSSDSEVSTL
jgi:hypothetical protein